MVLTQFWFYVVLWRFEIATHEGTCFLVQRFQGDLDVSGLSTIPKVYHANLNSKTCRNSRKDKIQFGPKKRVFAIVVRHLGEKCYNSQFLALIVSDTF